MRRTHPLIAGGGPAGAMAALMLAEAGEKPLLIERTAEPHDPVCGGFLGWDALAMLDRAGITPSALGAHKVVELHLVAGRRSARIALPFAAAGLSRRTLDATLLSRAGQAGAIVHRGVTVRDVDIEKRSVRTATGEIEASAIFLATGKHDVRHVNRDAVRDEDPAIGMRVRLAATPALNRALEHRIELILLDRGYAGLVLQEDGSANLCFTVAQSRLSEAGGDRERLLAGLAAEAPVLGERLGQSDGWSGWASVAHIPYGWQAAATTPGLFRLGDQAAVIASLAGDGIAIALKSARMAADRYLRFGPDGAPGFQRDFRKAAQRPLWIAQRLRSAAENAAISSFSTAMLAHFPLPAQIASRATRIGVY